MKTKEEKPEKIIHKMNCPYCEAPITGVHTSGEFFECPKCKKLLQLF